MITAITDHPYAKLFDWDVDSGSYFYKQFISGLLITVALVGLDQSMMQKTLTVSNAKTQRKMCSHLVFFIALAQTLFLGLGVLFICMPGKKEYNSIVKMAGS